MGARACKAGLPAELHAPRNYMILIMSLVEFRVTDYLLSKQVLSQLSYTPARWNLYTLKHLQSLPQPLQLRRSVHSVQR